MSKTIPIALLTNLTGSTPTPAYALQITRTDGVVFGFTSARRSTTIGSVLYDATQGLDISSIATSAGLAVDNLELTTLDDGSLFQRSEVLAGVWQNAAFLIFRYSWASPGDGVEYLLAGTIGQVRLLGGSVVCELRGLQQYLQQPVGNVTSMTCRARFADFPTQSGRNRCGLDAADWTDALIVDSVSSQRAFVATPDPGALAPGDAHITSVSLLLHCNGTNGSTTFTDASPLALSVVANGNAQLSTSEKKFGTASIAFDGTGDYVQVTSGTIPAAFDFSASDFTIEAWVYRAAASVMTIFTARNDGVGGSGLVWYMDAAGKPIVVVNGTSYTSATLSVSLSTWTHVALTRSGSTWRTFVGGALSDTITQGDYTTPSGYGVRLGSSNDGGGPFNGYMDEIRITKGVARYTAAFTAPTQEFYDVAPEPALPAKSELWYNEGIITWTGGLNSGLQSRVKTYGAASDFVLISDLPHAVQVGDTLDALAGCTKRMNEDCYTRFDNVLNFQGEPHMPGPDALTQTPEVSV